MSTKNIETLSKDLFNHVTETYISYDHQPLFGVATIKNGQYVFNAYKETEAGYMLFIYAKPEPQILTQMGNGEIPVLELLSHPDTELWKETLDADENLTVTPVLFETLTPAELPTKEATLTKR